MYYLFNCFVPDCFIEYKDYSPTWISPRKFLFYREIKDSQNGKIYLYDIEREKYQLLAHIKDMDLTINEYPKFRQLDYLKYYLSPNNIIDINKKNLLTNSFNYNPLDYTSYECVGSFLITDSSTIKDGCLQFKLKFTNTVSKSIKEIYIDRYLLENLNVELEATINDTLEHTIIKKEQLLRDQIKFSVEKSFDCNVYVITVTNNLNNETLFYLYKPKNNKLEYLSKINDLAYRGYYIAKGKSIVAFAQKKFYIIKNKKMLKQYSFNCNRIIPERVILTKNGFMVYGYESKNKPLDNEGSSEGRFSFELRKFNSLSKATKIYIPNYIQHPLYYYDINDEFNHIIFTDEHFNSIYLYDIKTQFMSKITEIGASRLCVNFRNKFYHFFHY